MKIEIYDNDGDVVGQLEVPRVPVKGDYIVVNERVAEVWRVVFNVSEMPRVQLGRWFSTRGNGSQGAVFLEQPYALLTLGNHFRARVSGRSGGIG